MHPRNIALVAFSVVVLGALVLLLVKVTASAEVEVPEEALAEARARYARSQAAHNRASSAPPAAASSSAAEAARARRARMAAEQAREAPPPRRTTARLPPQPEEPPRELSPREEDLQTQRNELRSAYDRGNYEVALQQAKEYLRLRPNDRYVMRVTVTSACAVGDEETARALYEQMVEEDRRIERLRCAKYGFEF